MVPFEAIIEIEMHLNGQLEKTIEKIIQKKKTSCPIQKEQLVNSRAPTPPSALVMIHVYHTFGKYIRYKKVSCYFIEPIVIVSIC
jgi:hypothetical protein